VQQLSVVIWPEPYRPIAYIIHAFNHIRNCNLRNYNQSADWFNLFHWSPLFSLP